MDFTIKLATYDDLEAADRVERSASRGVYLTDAWHYFSTLKGELVCAYDGERMIGIGRFTVLPDRYTRNRQSWQRRMAALRWLCSPV